MSSDPPGRTVLYIGGTGRTGSTVLERLLGQDPRFVAAGELTFLWRNAAGGGACSCGEPLVECEHWERVVATAFGGWQGVDPARLFELRRRFNPAHYPLMVSDRLLRRRLASLEDLPSVSAQLYPALAEVAGAEVVIDSSKEPQYAEILARASDLDVHFLHLVRDPRAVAHSWRRRRQMGPTSAIGGIGSGGRRLMPQAYRQSAGEDMEQRSVVVSAAYYGVANLMAELLWRPRPSRYLRVTYEDLIRDPVQVLGRIGSFVGVDLDGERLLHQAAAQPRALHTAGGNPNRLVPGGVALRADDEWRAPRHRRRRWAAAAVTWPWLIHYGYLGRGHRRRVDATGGPSA